jgi:NAD(P)H-dependent FMN reductase
VQVLAVSGSLGAGSGNDALLRLAQARAPEGLEVVLFDGLEPIPAFNPDTEPSPVPVERWRAVVQTAEALLFATPEYAHGLPGALKNALDWLVGTGDLYGKTAAIVSAAPSPERGGHARADLERTLSAQGTAVVASRTIAVASATRTDPGADPEVAVAIDEVLAVLVSARRRERTPRASG